MLTLTWDDLGLDETKLGELTKAQIETKLVDVVALATVKAPCLFADTADPAKVAAGKAILRGAVLRWFDKASRGFGELQTQHAGPFGITLDTRQNSGSVVWPTEWADLTSLCGAASVGPMGSFPPSDNYARLFRTGC